jgi:hypothetical protein
MDVMSNYLVYICQAVKNRAGLERYWQVAPATYPKNIDALAAYAQCEVLDADQDERVEGVVIAEFPPFEQTVAWFNGDALSELAKTEQMATNISAWSWTVESRLLVNAMPTALPMSSWFAVKLLTRGAQYLLAARE